MFTNQFGFQQPGMQYNGMQPQQQRKVSNNLTAEEIAELHQNKPEFNLGISREDHLRAICNHRSEDGMHDTLEYDAKDPNAFVCKICGWKFTPISTDATEEYVQNITDEFINLLQTIKILFADFPSEAARNFFDIIPMAQKTPKLFELAVRSINKYDNSNMYGFQNQSNNAAFLLNNFMGAIGAGAVPGYQPMYNQGYAQQQQPMGANPVFQQQNPFGYAGASQFGGYQAQPGYQPTQQGFAYNPTAPQPQAQQPQAAAAPAAETTTTTNNVQA